MRIMTVIAASIVSILVLLGAAHESKASLSRLLGINEIGIDSINRISQVIDQTFRSLEFLRKEFDADVDGYIAEIDRITAARMQEFSGEVANVERIVDEIIDEIEAIRSRAFYDARQLIWDVECIAPVYAEELKTTLGDLIKIVSDSEAELRLPLGATAEVFVKPVNIASPDIAYEEIKAGYLTALESVEEETSVLFILSSYGNISRVARITSCHFRGLVLSKYFFAEVAYYEGLSSPWAMLTGLDRF
ncbi:MAG: hypothetical protein ABJF50_10650 [Paracoccaceae bacterium]